MMMVAPQSVLHILMLLNEYQMLSYVKFSPNKMPPLHRERERIVWHFLRGGQVVASLGPASWSEDSRDFCWQMKKFFRYDAMAADMLLIL